MRLANLPEETVIIRLFVFTPSVEYTHTLLSTSPQNRFSLSPNPIIAIIFDFPSYPTAIRTILRARA